MENHDLQTEEHFMNVFGSSLEKISGHISSNDKMSLNLRAISDAAEFIVQHKGTT
jgi:hypothetical protein